jgi:hypothetical protein
VLVAGLVFAALIYALAPEDHDAALACFGAARLADSSGREPPEGSSAKRERTLFQRPVAPGSGGDAPAREFDREGRGSAVP